ncbi:MAG: efflux transporter outer membrane subunit [Xanthomonadaceae bacterium]|jgi:NodT family efflux transporter outer membrane factor (OMF) lipoprotein|nr:efflux transporter outer membrane subunit [Xanthomonadaceae bacterium]
MQPNDHRPFRARNRHRIAAWPIPLTLCCALLAACVSSRGLHPQGQLTDADSLDAGRSLAPASLSPASWPAVDWWRELDDPQLDALIDEALRGSPTLDAADARLRLAQAQAGAADAARTPTLSGTGTYIGADNNGSYGSETRIGLGFGHAFDLWGGQRAAWEAALGQARAAGIDAQAARLTLSAAVAQSYVMLGYAWRLQDIGNDELARAEKMLELTRQRCSAGIDDMVSLRQSEAAVPAARQQVQAARWQIQRAQTALAALLGQGPDRGLAIGRPRALNPARLSVPSVLPSELLGRRPDVVAARWRVEAAGHSIRAAQAQFHPNINLNALVGISPQSWNLLHDSPWSGSLNPLSMGPAISLPIFDGGRLRANLAQSDAQYDLAVADYNGLLVSALREVADQINTLASLDQQIQQQSQSEAIAQAGYDLARQRYQAGIGGYLEVLGAQQQLLSAQQRTASLQSDQIQASVRLNQALGGGYRPAAPDPKKTSAIAVH